ncbi:protein phosphatase methylesterase [Atractiella rhizophila]|nr:protein phosphatase methylesterase [Atractiella rhizophila]
MSSFQRDLLRSKLSSLPADALTNEEEEEEEEEGSFSADSLQGFSNFQARQAERQAKSPSTSTSNPRRKTGADYTPLSAVSFFKEALEIQVGATTFRAYYSPPSKDGFLFVCHHGAGYSGLSFACFAQYISTLDPTMGILSYDARGHGKTISTPKEEEDDLALSTLSSDLVGLLKALIPEKEKAPKLVLIGHSMGGAVVAHACNSIQADVAPVLGVGILDVVEDIALDALAHMPTIISNRPSGFNSLEDAISWHIKSHTLRNLNSARLSVPSLFVPSSQTPTLTETQSLSLSVPTKAPWSDEMEEEMEELELPPEKEVPGKRFQFAWRTDLSRGEPYWRGWFEGLSKKFLECKAAKILVLAGTDRLDKELMVAQMQGKYQLVVYQEVGHCLHEDAPERLATTMLDFVKRNSQSQEDILRKVKKIGQQ